MIVPDVPEVELAEEVLIVVYLNLRNDDQRKEQISVKKGFCKKNW
jgi:hypothetical protein